MPGVGNNSIRDFKISRLFNLSLSVARVVHTTEIFWVPPANNVVKINTNGFAIGKPVSTSISVVFNGPNFEFLGGFSHNISHASAYMEEICALMFSMEKASEKG